MKRFIGGLVVMVLMACVHGVGQDMDIQMEKEKKNLLAKDTALASASAKKGILNAFYPQMTARSLLFPENGYPIYGSGACEKVKKRTDMSDWRGKLEWEPLFADVSGAGDLGYTHGRFKRPKTGRDGKERMEYSYYGTIWEKIGGEWKVVVSQGLILLTGLGQPPAVNRMDELKPGEAAKQVMETEHAFSAYSVEHGASEAFYRFIADDGIALSAAGPPRRKEAYARAIAAAKSRKGKAGPESVLKWKPFFTHVAVSGDMAYNYGPYEYTVNSADGEEKVFYGYFITVWKKQSDGNWKFVFDGGQQAAGPF